MRKLTADSALKLDPSNDVAKDCLNWAALMLIDQDLNNADTKLLNGDKLGAVRRQLLFPLGISNCRPSRGYCASFQMGPRWSSTRPAKTGLGHHR
jgi:hypothetical protein